MVKKILSILSSLIFLAYADTRDQIRKEEINKYNTYERNQPEETREENRKAIDLNNAHDRLKTKELGARPNFTPVDAATVYHFVLKVSCSDGDNDLIPSIPRNRSLDWVFKIGKIVISSGSAHVDQEGYVRFSVSNTKTVKLKRITVTFNSVEKIVTIDSGPFDLIFKRQECNKKKP